jgi:hypothetical protein
MKTMKYYKLRSGNLQLINLILTLKYAKHY